MKIFIMTDLEGISGISRKEQVDELEPFALERLMADVNAAVRGALDGGATTVWVEDGHGSGKNFLPGKLDPRAIQVENLSHGEMVMKEADAIFSIGAHAMSGTQNAFLDHTQSSVCWHDYTVNGRKFGELGQQAIFAGAFGIPLVMVSGDFAACAEAREQFGNLCTAVVKHAVKRNEAVCIPLEEAENAIYMAAKTAMATIANARPFRILLPAEVKVEFNRADYCDDILEQSDYRYERLDARTLRKVIPKIESFHDVLLHGK